MPDLATRWQIIHTYRHTKRVQRLRYTDEHKQLIKLHLFTCTDPRRTLSCSRCSWCRPPPWSRCCRSPASGTPRPRTSRTSCCGSGREAPSSRRSPRDIPSPAVGESEGGRTQVYRQSPPEVTGYYFRWARQR